MAQEQEWVPKPPEPFDRDRVYATLEKLLDVARDGELGYREAAENVRDPELRSFFADQSQERTRIATQLKEEMERLGKWESTHEGTVAGGLRNAWIDVAGMTRADDHTILSAVESGEDAARKAYEEALLEPLPEEVMGMFRQQAQIVTAAHDHVKLLRDRKKAA